MPKSANPEATGTKGAKAPRTNPNEYDFVVLRSNKPTYCADKDAVKAALSSGSGKNVAVFQRLEGVGLATQTVVTGLDD